jgi:AraC-like DNA-binding protein
LARQAAMSRKSFQRAFKRETRQTVTEYIRDARMTKAKGLLADPNRRQVTDVAWEVGYQDLTHFERDFKRLTGMTPSEYRKINCRS